MQQRITDQAIVAARPEKERVEPHLPYAFLSERERGTAGSVDDVATIFLTNRECPFRCLMCDLWKHTTDETVPLGAIPAQIEYALARLPASRRIKLYNSGNFFDAKAIPPDDYEAIAERLVGFESVLVENHPRLCGARCVEFRDLIEGRLEVALGLETVHPDVLPRLNKRMTVDDYQRAVAFLVDEDIAVRTFVLLRPPFLSEEEGVEWALRTMETAFDAGSECCSVIPTRAGNGIMEKLERAGAFQAPRMASIEEVLARGLAMKRGRVFVDLWDVDRFYDCARCGPLRRDRLQTMNLQQRIVDPVSCLCGEAE